jgi:hypothetical protein
MISYDLIRGHSFRLQRVGDKSPSANCVDYGVPIYFSELELRRICKSIIEVAEELCESERYSQLDMRAMAGYIQRRRSGEYPSF